MTTITVCICTYRRASLVDTISSVLSQELSPDYKVRIHVIDNDPDGYAAPLVAAFSDQPRPVQYFRASPPNISVARNLALETAHGTWIAFIDDDEVAKEDWLAELLRVAHSYRADVVQGTVETTYAPTTPVWVKDSRIFERQLPPEGTSLPAAYSGNVLIARALLSSGERFNLAFGLSGGEDTDFFRRLRHRGAQIKSAPSALIHEPLAPERATFRYAIARSFRTGRNYGRIIAADGRRYSAVAVALSSTAKAGVFSAVAGLSLVLGFGAFARGACRAASQVGKLLGTVGSLKVSK